MALNKYITRNSLTSAAVKVSGDSGSTTISLVDDLGGEHFSTQNPSVAIKSITWTGGANGVITITRNEIVIFTLQANAAGMLDFSGDFQFPDSTESTSDIEISVNNIQCELWLRLSKTGYDLPLPITPKP